MKTKLLLLAIIAFMANEVFAQDIKIAVQAGLNLSTVSTKINPDFEEVFFKYTTYRPGLRIGVLAEYSFKDEMAIQSGLYYTQKGYYKDIDEMEKVFNENNSNGLEMSGKWGNRYNYLEMPIHYVYKFKDFQFFTGPYLAYGLGGKSTLDVEFSDNEGNEVYDETADITAVSGDVNEDEFFDKSVMEIVVYKKFDYGIDLGVGYTYDKFLFQVQYSLGMININPQIKGSDIDVDEELSYKNRAFTFSVSYFIK